MLHNLPLYSVTLPAIYTSISFTWGGSCSRLLTHVTWQWHFKFLFLSVTLYSSKGPISFLMETRTASFVMWSTQVIEKRISLHNCSYRMYTKLKLVYINPLCRPHHKRRSALLHQKGNRSRLKIRSQKKSSIRMELN